MRPFSTDISLPGLDRLSRALGQVDDHILQDKYSIFGPQGRHILGDVTGASTLFDLAKAARHPIRAASREQDSADIEQMAINNPLLMTNRMPPELPSSIPGVTLRRVHGASANKPIPYQRGEAIDGPMKYSYLDEGGSRQALWRGGRQSRFEEMFETGMHSGVPVAYNAVAEDGSVLGSVAFQVHKNGVGVDSVYVDPQFRKTALGHDLMRAAANAHPSKNFGAYFVNERLGAVITKRAQRQGYNYLEDPMAIFEKGREEGPRKSHQRPPLTHQELHDTAMSIARERRTPPPAVHPDTISLPRYMREPRPTRTQELQSRRQELRDLHRQHMSHMARTGVTHFNPQRRGGR